MMADGMHLTTLRQLVGSVVVPELMGYTHQQLADACMSLSLPEPSGEGTKRERVSQSFAALPDADLPIVAEQILTQTLAGASTRNAIQDVLWAEGSLETPKRTRREIARDLDLADLLHNADRFTVLLGRLWVLDDDPFSWLGESTNSLRDRIERHVFHKPRDWTTEELFEQLGALEATRRQVHTIPGGAGLCRYLLDEPAQRHIVRSTTVTHAASSRSMSSSKPR